MFINNWIRKLRQILKKKTPYEKIWEAFDELGFKPQFGDALEFDGIKLVDENSMHYFDGWTQEEMDV
jgi:hypothetical protein